MSRDTAPCPFEEEVLLLTDGELPFTRRVVVEAHLGVCESCAALEDLVTQVEEVVASEDVAPLGVTDAALERLPAPGPVFRPYVIAAAAAVLVAIAVHEPAEVTVPASETATARVESDTAPEASTAGPPETASAPRAPWPQLPPPVPAAGPQLRRVLAELPAPDTNATAYEGGVRSAAELVERRGGRGAAALAELLRDGEPDMRRSALHVAALVEAPAVTRALGDLLPDVSLGDRAAELLARRPDQATVAALVADLREAPRPRTIAVLAELGGREAARALADASWTAAPDQRPLLIDAAIRADAGIGAALVVESAEPGVASPDLRRSVQEHHESLVPHLLRFAAGRDVLRSRASARVLGWTGSPWAVPRLEALARSGRTAEAAVRALLDHGSRDAVLAAFDATVTLGSEDRLSPAWDGQDAAEPVLLELLTTGASPQRRAALRLMGRCGGERTVDALARLTLARAELPDALAALGAIGGEAAVAAIVSHEAVPGLEADVITALGRCATPAAVAELARIARDSPEHRTLVARALAGFETPASAAVLIDLLDDPRAGRVALETLEAMPLGVAVPALLHPYEQTVPPDVRRALARLTGRDLGPSPVAWREWLAARS